jgi:hypothetical protein
MTMKPTTLGITKYAGACVAGLATSCVIAAPAIAMAPPAPAPDPGSSQHHKIFDSLDGRQGPAPSAPATRPAPTSDGVDWTTIAAVVGGGMALTGFVALGATQIRRRQAHPA